MKTKAMITTKVNDDENGENKDAVINPTAAGHEERRWRASLSNLEPLQIELDDWSNSNQRVLDSMPRGQVNVPFPSH